MKGINQFKNLSQRQAAMRTSLALLLDKLVSGEANPFSRVQTGVPSATLSKETSIVNALREANAKVSASESTKRDLKYLVIHIERAVKAMNLQDFPVSQVTRKTVKMLLEEISTTSDRFNKNRSNLMILFSELCEAEAIDNNPVRDIKKKKVVKHLRTVLTDDERIKVNEHLRTHYPSFHRFLHIFFHSGARISELLRVRECDLDLPNQRYKVVIQKGRNYKEVWKTIKDVALPYWNEIHQRCSKGDLLFSVGLLPGAVAIKPYQVTKRWYRLVKKKIGIAADFYSLKHLHTTEVVDMLSEAEAAKHNEHTNTAMVVGIYDVKNGARKHSSLKGLKNKFV